MLVSHHKRKKKGKKKERKKEKKKIEDVQEKEPVGSQYQILPSEEEIEVYIIDGTW